MKKFGLLILLGLTQTQVYAMGDGSFGIGHFVPNQQFRENFQRMLDEQRMEREKQEQEKRKRLEESNTFTDDDYNDILKEKIGDLKSINAILTRYKDSFRRLREDNSQGVDRVRDKTLKILKTRIWEYIPNKNLRDLVNHLHHDYAQSDIPKHEKLFHLRNKITILKKHLVFLRDYCMKKNETPIEVFNFLWWVDFALAMHKYSKDWDKYNMVLKELDEGFN